MDKENSIPCGLTIRCFEFNMIGENCYVVSDETRDCVIIDCGAYWKDEREELVEYITKNELRPVRLLATHGHLDHHFGDNTVYDTYGLSPELSDEDEYVYKSLLYQAEKYFHLKLNYKFPAPGRYLQDGETISFGNHELLVLPTPGHTPGSVSFYCKSEGFLFTGDTLFRGSVGRTDLDGGSMFQLINSLRELAQLPDETEVLPGHGEPTTIGYELAHNPYMDR